MEPLTYQWKHYSASLTEKEWTSNPTKYWRLSGKGKNKQGKGVCFAGEKGKRLYMLEINKEWKL